MTVPVYFCLDRVAGYWEISDSENCSMGMKQLIDGRVMMPEVKS